MTTNTLSSVPLLPSIQLFFRLIGGASKDAIEQHIKTFRIPLAFVSKPFQFDFDFNIGGVELMKHGENSINGLTLSQDGNKLTLYGTPKQTSVKHRHILYFEFWTEDDSSQAKAKDPVCKIPIEFYIAHDEWTVQPAEYGLYENVDQEAEGKCSSTAEHTIEIIAASQRGRSHAHAAKPRDDAFFIDVNEETGWVFVAVADGAGSAKYSRKGSELAVSTVVKELKEHLTPEYNETSMQADFCEAVKSAWAAIDNEAKCKEATLRDYNTTLLCCAFKYLDERKEFIFVSYWVGDGGAALLRPNDSENVWILGKPDRGAYVNGSSFLTAAEENTDEVITKRIHFSSAGSFEALILATDGITDSFFEFGAEVMNESRWLDFYENILPNGSHGNPESIPVNLNDTTQKPLEKANALLEWLTFWSWGNYDDRTILIVKPK